MPRSAASAENCPTTSSAAAPASADAGSDDQQVGRLGLGRGERLVAAERDLHREPLLIEALAQQAAQIGVVLDDEDTRRAHRAKYGHRPLNGG